MQKINLVEFKKEILEKFKCQGCASCCAVEGFVYVTSEEMSVIAAKLNISLSELKANYVIRDKGWSLISTPDFHPACFLKDKKCTIYDSRPHACRTYPDWQTIWLNEASLLAEIKVCPGLKKAVSLIKGEEYD